MISRVLLAPCLVTVFLMLQSNPLSLAQHTVLSVTHPTLPFSFFNVQLLQEGQAHCKSVLQGTRKLERLKEPFISLMTLPQRHPTEEYAVFQWTNDIPIPDITHFALNMKYCTCWIVQVVVISIEE